MMFSVEDAVKRYELGVEEYEVAEEVSGPEERHTQPSASKKQKPARSKDLRLTLFKQDYNVNKVAGGKKGRQVSIIITGTEWRVSSSFIPSC